MRKDYVQTIFLLPNKYKELIKYGHLRTTDYDYDVVELPDDIYPLQAKRVGRFTYDNSDEIVNVITTD